jgi:hypothetical protein
MPDVRPAVPRSSFIKPDADYDAVSVGAKFQSDFNRDRIIK